jgi:hypothetical protein
MEAHAWKTVFVFVQKDGGAMIAQIENVRHVFPVLLVFLVFLGKTMRPTVVAVLMV